MQVEMPLKSVIHTENISLKYKVKTFQTKKESKKWIVIIITNEDMKYTVVQGFPTFSARGR